jgi:hypothetical protein
MGVEEIAAGVMMTLALAMAAPEGSVTCPRKVPEAACGAGVCGAAVCDTASVAHHGNDKTMSAK